VRKYLWRLFLPVYIYAYVYVYVPAVYDGTEADQCGFFNASFGQGS
jgi:hypothetical protein